MQPLLRACFGSRAAALLTRKRHPRRDRPPRRLRPRRSRRCGAAPKRGISAKPGRLPTPPIVRPAEVELDALAKLLNGTNRATLFCGRGCSGAHPKLMELAETLKSPIVHALGDKEHAEFDNPYDVGMTGFVGFSSGYAAMHACESC
jgi:pyruvate dehydrogenase (quinone)